MAAKVVHKRGKSKEKIACTDKAYDGDSASFRWSEVSCRSCLKFRPADR